MWKLIVVSLAALGVVGVIAAVAIVAAGGGLDRDEGLAATDVAGKGEVSDTEAASTVGQGPVVETPADEQLPTTVSDSRPRTAYRAWGSG